MAHTWDIIPHPTGYFTLRGVGVKNKGDQYGPFKSRKDAEIGMQVAIADKTHPYDETGKSLSGD